MLAIAKKFEEEGFTCSLIKAGSDGVTPFDQLFILMESKTQDTQARLELMKIPDASGEDIYQFVMPLAAGIHGERFADVSRLLLFINEQLPLLGFGLNEAHALVYFKSMFPVEGHAVPHAILIKTARLIYTFARIFEAPILQLANDRITHTQAVEMVKGLLEKATAAKALDDLYKKASTSDT